MRYVNCMETQTGVTEVANFDAKHDNGTAWKLVVPCKGKSADVVTKRAALFVRNYCLKHGISGQVTITPEVGNAFRMTDYAAGV